MTNLKQRADSTGKTLYVGMDVHIKSWDISIQLDKVHIRSFQQPPEAHKLVKRLNRDYPKATIRCAYEAGFSGFGLQHQLTEAGLSCIVVSAADVPQTDKVRKTKTDRSDSIRIAIALEAGQPHPIYILAQFTESNRRLVRYHGQLLRDLQRS